MHKCDFVSFCLGGWWVSGSVCLLFSFSQANFEYFSVFIAPDIISVPFTLSSFWDFGYKYSILFDIVPHSSTAFYFLHLFFSLFFRLKNFYWSTLRLLDSFVLSPWMLSPASTFFHLIILFFSPRISNWFFLIVFLLRFIIYSFTVTMML